MARLCWNDLLFCGVNPDDAIRRAFAFGGALAGAAAFVFALYYSRPYGSHGAASGLLAFAAAILGGIGNPVGALASGLVLGVGSAFSDYLLAAQWTPVLMQVLLVGLLWLRPTGLAAGEPADDLTTKTDRDAVMARVMGQRAPLNRRWLWGFIAAALVFPAVSGPYWQVILTGMGVFVVLTLGLNMLLGLAGVLDLGYVVSFGIGGYVTAMLTNRWTGIGALIPQPVDFMFLLIVSMTLAGLFGALKGRLAVRLRSDYLAVVTLSLGLLARQTIINLNDVTGGRGGIAALPPPHLFT